jgi:hypothetical protein
MYDKVILLCSMLTPDVRVLNKVVHRLGRTWIRGDKARKSPGANSEWQKFLKDLGLTFWAPGVQNHAEALAVYKPDYSERLTIARRPCRGAGGCVAVILDIHWMCTGGELPPFPPLTDQEYPPHQYAAADVGTSQPVKRALHSVTLPDPYVLPVGGCTG